MKYGRTALLGIGALLAITACNSSGDGGAAGSSGGTGTSGSTAGTGASTGTSGGGTGSATGTSGGTGTSGSDTGAGGTTGASGATGASGGSGATGGSGSLSDAGVDATVSTAAQLHVGATATYRGGDPINGTPPVLAALGDAVVLAGSSSDPKVVGLTSFADASTESEAFVGRLNRDGTFAWSAPLPPAGLPRGVVVDSAGDIVVAAPYLVDFDLVTVGSVGTDLYLAKFTASGTSVYGIDESVAGVGPNDVLDPAGVAADSMGNVYVVGQIVIEETDTEEVWFAKYDSTGKNVFSKQFAAPPMGLEALASAVTVLPNDEVVVTGTFEGTLDLGGTTLVTEAEGGTQISGFVARFGSDGTLISAVQFGDGLFSEGSALAPAPNGDVLLGGILSGSLGLPGLGLTGNFGMGTPMAARFNRAGAAEWASTLDAGALGTLPNAAAYDLAGRTHLVGPFGASIVVANFDEAGAPLANLLASTTGDAGMGVQGASIVVDSMQSLWVSGVFDTHTTLGTQMLTGNIVGIFVARIDPGTP
jgi:collagen type VII alpha